MQCIAEFVQCIAEFLYCDLLVGEDRGELLMNVRQLGIECGDQYTPWVFPSFFKFRFDPSFVSFCCRLKAIKPTLLQVQKAL